MSQDNIQTQVSNDTALRDGLAKNHKPSEKLIVAGKEVAVSIIITLLDERIAMAHESESSRLRHYEAAATYRRGLETTKELVSDVRAQMILRVGKTSPSLADYGIAQRKVRGALSLEARSFAVAKAKATRKARHTVGKKQLLLIHGERPAHVVFGESPPPATTPAPAPVSPTVTAPATAPPNGAINGAATNGMGAH